MAGRKTYHHGDLRSALLQAALALIRDADAGEFTLREVARRAGVSHAAPYRHFRDKAELLAAIAEEGFKSLTSAMHASARQAHDAHGRLQNAGVAYVEFAQDHPEHFHIMFTVDLKENLHPCAKAAADRCFGELMKLVAACQGDPAADPACARTPALMAWTQVHGIAELALRGSLGFATRKEVREFSKAATGIFASGLRSDADVRASREPMPLPRRRPKILG